MFSERKSIPRLHSTLEDAVAALVVVEDDGDRPSLEQVLSPFPWKFRVACGECEARAMLAGGFIPVVIIDGDAQSVSWRGFLEQGATADDAQRPKYIIVSRLADSGMWAEVLNLGGYHLLPNPVAAEELAWVMRSALWEPGRARAPVQHKVKEQFAWNGY